MDERGDGDFRNNCFWIIWATGVGIMRGREKKHQLIIFKLDEPN